MNEKIVFDSLMALGGLIGLGNKFYALLDSNTVWSRKSNSINILSYPVTALIPYFYLELWLSFISASLNLLTWIGIYIFRSPVNEDLLGRET